MTILLYMALFVPSNILEDAVGVVVVEHCKNLWREGGPEECHKYIRSLGDRRNLRMLRKLYREEWLFSSYAAFTAAKIIGDGEVAAFCQQFKLNTPNWVAAFYTLEDRPKPAVMSYIKSVCATGDAKARSHCYKVCSAAGWDDLLQQARADLRDETVVANVGLGGTLTLKIVAELYVERFNKKK